MKLSQQEYRQVRLSVAQHRALMYAIDIGYVSTDDHADDLKIHRETMDSLVRRGLAEYHGTSHPGVQHFVATVEGRQVFASYPSGRR